MTFDADSPLRDLDGLLAALGAKVDALQMGLRDVRPFLALGVAADEDVWLEVTIENLTRALDHALFALSQLHDTPPSQQ